MGVANCRVSNVPSQLPSLPGPHQAAPAAIASADTFTAIPCRGPGAGREVTAGGVFSDLLRLAAYLGAPS